MRLERGDWLGIDVGSSKKKVATFCRIVSEGEGSVEVFFEQGPAGEGYPDKNTGKGLIEKRLRPPTYLKAEVQAAVRQVLLGSELVNGWISGLGKHPSAVAIDAPVALARSGKGRLTEAASSPTFRTPDRATFEEQLLAQKDAFLRINNLWKCVGFTMYRTFAEMLDPEAGRLSQEEIAAMTCPGRDLPARLRETFPSDVYKRANGTEGLLTDKGRDVLAALVAVETSWTAVGVGAQRPNSQRMDGLERARTFARRDLAAGVRPCDMRRRTEAFADLWDAFTCAFAICCEDHGAVRFHGMPEDSEEVPELLLEEGVILSVAWTRKAAH